MKALIGGGRCAPGSHDALKALVRPGLALADARAVCGALHLRQAATLARAAHAGDYALARTPATEVLLYLTGQRQVTRALARAGLRADTATVAWVAFSEAGETEDARGGADSGKSGAREATEGGAEGGAGDSLPEPLHGLVAPDDSVLSADGFDYRGFGLPQGALEANPPARWPTLVLTRCALLPVRARS